MRMIRYFAAFLALAFAAAPVWAVDYKRDTTFAPPLIHRVRDVFIQPDGKILVGGEFWTGDNADVFIMRLNADGTQDHSFNSPLNFPTVSSFLHAGVRRIRPLPNGQFLLTGVFRVGSQNTSYVRINSDGSVDGTLALALTGTEVDLLPDGKLVACGIRNVNGTSYEVAHRINADGTVDPSFRVTFAGGACDNVVSSTNGSVLITGYLQGPSGLIGGLWRLRSDGSIDPSFNPVAPEGVAAGGLKELSDGRIFLGGGTGSALLRPDGSLDLYIPRCNGEALELMPDGTMLMSKCTKWPGSTQINFARVLPDGTVDPTLDWINLADSEVAGFRSTGNGGIFIFGEMRVFMGGISELARVIPDLTPPKAKFDFDGDGRSDIGVFRPSDHYWYISASTTGQSYTLWGLADDKLAAHDFDRDGKTDIGVFRNGIWYGQTSASGYKYAVMGGAGDQVLAGTFYDLYVAGNRERWVTRGDRNGVPTWYIWSDPGTPVPITISGELSTDKPIVGDFDGDSWDDLGYFRDGLWRSRPTDQGAPVKTFQWGIAGDIAVPGDYDGDRQTDYAIFRPSTGAWWIYRSTAGIFALQFGQSGDIPVPADYDGDGKTDIAIYRNGAWWQYLSATGTVGFVSWGQAGDRPIPAQAQ